MVLGNGKNVFVEALIGRSQIQSQRQDLVPPQLMIASPTLVFF